METIKVEPTPQYLLRLKCDVIRANEEWQQAEKDSQDEVDAEGKLRVAVDKLLAWCPEYKQYTMVSELDYWLKREVKWGKDIATE